jgi:hypothetical protein
MKLDCTNEWQQQKINGIRTEFSTLCDSALGALARDIAI